MIEIAISKSGGETNTLKRGERLGIAIVVAVNGHGGHFDKGGKPYILHTLSVALMDPTFDEEQQCIGVLHDVIEDGDVTYQQLRDAGMTDRIIEGVRCLTKIPGETYDEYKAKV